MKNQELTDAEFIEAMQIYKLDHKPDGWPAVQQWKIDRLIDIIFKMTNNDSPKNQGAKFDTDKLRLDLLPIEALNGTAQVLGFGAKKYGDYNWSQGINYSRVYGALLRHITAWWAGEDNDPESGINHLHHVGCCIAFLQTYTERGMKDFDDRPE